MHPFTFIRANDKTSAIQSAKENKGAKFIGGGTNLVDLMKMNIETPDRLINIGALPLKKIQKLSNGNLLIGALVTNTELAYDKQVQTGFPFLSEAILAGASPQLRNLATTGGNILQRTRCYYFYDTAAACNKRVPGSGCAALKGYNRIHAVLGTSDKCIATHPSDMCVALIALDAIVHVAGATGERAIKFSDFHVSPGDHPEIEHSLQAGDLIIAVEIPALSFAKNSTYLKIRDRASYDFALSSAAVAVDLKGGIIRNARIAFGGIATKPWRAAEVEQWLIGKEATFGNFKEAAELSMKGAQGYQFNSFKIELAKRTLISALQKTGGDS